MKGERPAEIVGFARTMRANAVKLSSPAGEVFDTCGTGGDRSGTFNISSAAALVVAACGVKVAKHGNRSVSSRCGSADVFEQLGVNVAAAPAVVERTLHEANIAFFFAPTFHPSMKHAAPTRRELGIRTAFNLLGPLTNPAGASRQIVGVPKSELTELLARALMLLGSTRAWVVHGADGIDEISTTGYTKVSECRDGAVHTFYVHPADFGFHEGGVRRSEGWRRGGECGDRAPDPGRRARGAARRRRAQCRRGAVRRRRARSRSRQASRLPQRRSIQGRPERRSSGWREVPSRRPRLSHERARPAADDRRGNRADHRGPARARAGRGAGATRGRRRAARIPLRVGARGGGPGECDRRVQAPIAVARRAGCPATTRSPLRGNTNRAAPRRSRC